MEIVKVVDLIKAYNNGDKSRNVLNKISFTVNEGEILGIIAESGSGKSTLMHILAGLEGTSSGKVFIGDTEITNLMLDEATEFRRKNIGVLYQFYNLIPSLTVEQNITFPCLLDASPLDVRHYSDVIGTLALNNIQNRYPSELTAYESQTVALARAIMSKPKVIICDEPTGNLSTKETEKFLDLLKKAHDKYNLTIIIMSSSKRPFVYCDNVIRLVDGVIVGGENKNEK